jgi:hypothetical protein
MEYSLNVETSESLVAAACLVLAFKMKGIEVILPLILRRSAVPFSLARLVGGSQYCGTGTRRNRNSLPLQNRNRNLISGTGTVIKWNHKFDTV